MDWRTKNSHEKSLNTQQIKSRFKNSNFSWNHNFFVNILHTFPITMIQLLFSQNYADLENEKKYCSFGDCHDSTVENTDAPLSFKLTKNAKLEPGE